MNKLVLYLNLVCLFWANATSTPPTGLPNLKNSAKLDIENSLMSLEPSDKTLLFHEPSFPEDKFESDVMINKKSSNIKPETNNKFNPINVVKPIHEQIVKVKESLMHPNNPAFGGIHFWSPEQFLEKIHQTGHHFFTGINGAIFGLAHPQNQDYPFPYRMAAKP